MKEQNGECVTWPSELAALEQLFAEKFRLKNHTSEKSSDSSHSEVILNFNEISS